MKKVFYFFSMILLVNCTKNEKQKNSILLADNKENIPLVNIEFSNNYELIRKRIQNSFNENLCGKCSRIYFKIPFKYENQEIKLKLITDFDTPYCSDCGIPMRNRFYYYINLNNHNGILAENEFVNIESLEFKLIQFFKEIGKNENIAPDKFNQLNFLLEWELKTSSETIKKVITKIINARLSFIKEKLKLKQINFEKINSSKLRELNEQYPLRIELDLGKTKSMPKPNLKKLRKLEKKLFEEIKTINEKET